MKKLALILLVTSLTACSSLKQINTKHKTERKELRIEQKQKLDKLKDKQKIERKLLQTKQALEFTLYGSEKYKELMALKEHLENLLK
ncbi:MAG: hypothetical protein ACRC23_01650 [Aeromonas jandaei]